MTSTTDYYLDIQRIYQGKAQKDLQKFKGILNSVCTSRKVAPESIQEEEIKLFCQNSALLEVTRMRTIEQELTTPQFDDCQAEFYDDESLAPWFITLRATESFNTKHGH